MPLTDSIRKVGDALLTQSKALPAAAASASTNSIDLGAVTIAPTNESFRAVLTVPALPSLVDDKTATFTFEDSANNSSFATIAGLPTLVMTGAGGAGAAAAELSVRLPDTTRRYIRVTCAVLTGGGDNTAVSYTLALKF